MSTPAENTALKSGAMTRHETREDWLTARLDGIGASSVAGILGLSRFSSPWSEWQRLIDRVVNGQPQTPMMEWGIRHESAMAKKLREVLHTADNLPWDQPWTLQDFGDYATWHAAEPSWLFATPDRIIIDNDLAQTEIQYLAVVELKCAWFQAAREWDEQIPVAYRVQLQTQMHCVGVRVGVYAVLLNGYDFRWYIEHYNPRFMQSAIRRLEKFRECVESGIPPSADFSEATSRAIAAHYQKPEDEHVELADEFTDLDREREIQIALKNEADRKIAAIDNQVKVAIGNATVGVLPNGRGGYSWKADKRGVRSFRKTTIKGE